MARNQDVVTVAQGAVVELTNSTATNITFTCLEGAIEVYVANSTQGVRRGVPYSKDQAEANRALSDYGTGNRVFAVGIGSGSKRTSIVLVTHA